jgi:cholesterol transport system auxiliary component
MNTLAKNYKGGGSNKGCWRLAIPLFLLLTGCNLLDISGPAPDLYNLTPKNTFSSDLPNVDWQLIVEEPIAAGGLDTSRVALRPRSTELKYLADARWTERAPKMIQTLLVESFENTGKIVAVGRQSIGLRSDYNLKTELREFQAETDGNTRVTKVRVRINVKIVQQPNRVIIGSKSFEHVEVVQNSGGMKDIVSAFDAAAGRVFKHIVEWTLNTAN